MSNSGPQNLQFDIRNSKFLTFSFVRGLIRNEERTMRLWKTAPDRSLQSFSQTYQGPYPHLVFLGRLIADAFRAFRASKHA